MEDSADEKHNNLIKDDPDVVDPLGSLKPRQRRLAQLLAEGKTNSDIQKELGYCASRISILQNNPHIRAEVARLQDRLFETTIEQRLKEFNNAALDHVEFVLKDRTNRVKVTEKNDVAKWVIEMQKSKAPQLHDVGQNLLGVFMDRLDARKTERRALSPQGTSEEGEDLAVIDLTPDETKALSAPVAPEEKDELASWVEDFCDESK
jgi:hypothetical protein